MSTWRNLPGTIDAEWVDRLRESRTPLVGPHFPDFQAVTL